MSLLKKIGKGLGRVVKKIAPIASVIPGPVGAIGRAASGALGGISTAALTLPALPAVVGAGGAIVRSLPGVGAAAGRVLRSPVGRAVAGGAAGAAIFDAAGNLIGFKKKKRRINPLNHKALTRALRRVERAKKTCSRVNRITVRKEKC